MRLLRSSRSSVAWTAPAATSRSRRSWTSFRIARPYASCPRRTIASNTACSNAPRTSAMLIDYIVGLMTPESSTQPTGPGVREREGPTGAGRGHPDELGHRPVGEGWVGAPPRRRAARRKTASSYGRSTTRQHPQPPTRDGTARGRRFKRAGRATRSIVGRDRVALDTASDIVGNLARLQDRDKQLLLLTSRSPVNGSFAASFARDGEAAPADVIDDVAAVVAVAKAGNVTLRVVSTADPQSAELLRALR